MTQMGEELLKELSGQIIGTAMDVLSELKPGLDEKLYERAMVIELRARGHVVDVQPSYPVHFREQFIGDLVPDLIANNVVMVDPKVVSAFNETLLSQMIGYLSVTSLELALLLNFKNAGLDWKRIVRQRSFESQPDFRA